MTKSQFTTHFKSHLDLKSPILETPFEFNDRILSTVLMRFQSLFHSRCAILKACFTAVFPTLIRSESTLIVVEADNGNSGNSSGHSTPTRTKDLRPTLDKLLSLVQALLLQEPRQSTLDEIFTLLEPYLKLSEKLSREMSVTLLHATLRTFLEKNNELPDFKETEQSFSPGPYIIGSLIPRCFDTSRRVQSTALACLQLLVSISS